MDVEAAAVAESQVEEQTREAVAGRPFKESVRRREAFDRESVGSEQHAQRIDHQWVVVDDEYSQVLGHDRVPTTFAGSGRPRYDTATCSIPTCGDVAASSRGPRRRHGGLTLILFSLFTSTATLMHWWTQAEAAPSNVRAKRWQTMIRM